VLLHRRGEQGGDETGTASRRGGDEDRVHRVALVRHGRGAASSDTALGDLADLVLGE
jgi:hypothetical protein